MQTNRRADAYLPAVTGLRGVAAGWVLLYHGWQFAHGPKLAVGGIDLTPLLATGYMGVDLFFVLSGFLLGLPFIAARRDPSLPAPSLRRFWANRFRRVLPAYWFQLSLLVVIALLAGTPAFGLGDVLAHYGLVFNLERNDSLVNPVYWSLPVEWDFYLFLPLLALPFRRARGALGWALLLVAAAIGFRLLCMAAVQQWGADGIAVYRWIIQLPGRIDQFVLGMLAAWAFLALPARGVTRGLAWAGLALVLLMSWGAAARGDFITQGIAPWLYWHYSLVALGFAAIVLAVSQHPRSLLARGLASRPIAWLGMVSYSLYLWHYPLLQWQQALAPAAWPAWWGVALVLPAILLVSWLSYRLIERPFLGARARRAEVAVQPSADRAD